MEYAQQKANLPPISEDEYGAPPQPLSPWTSRSPRSRASETDIQFISVSNINAVSS